MYRRQAVPAPVRPARPLRWLQPAWLQGKTVKASMPILGLYTCRPAESACSLGCMSVKHQAAAQQGDLKCASSQQPGTLRVFKYIDTVTRHCAHTTQMLMHIITLLPQAGHAVQIKPLCS